MALGNGKRDDLVRVQFVRRVRNVAGPRTVQEVGDVLALPHGVATRLIFSGQAVRVERAAPPPPPPEPEPVEEDEDEATEDDGAEDAPKPRRRRRR